MHLNVYPLTKQKTTTCHRIFLSFIFQIIRFSKELMMIIVFCYLLKSLVYFSFSVICYLCLLNEKPFWKLLFGVILVFGFLEFIKNFSNLPIGGSFVNHLAQVFEMNELKTTDRKNEPFSFQSNEPKDLSKNSDDAFLDKIFQTLPFCNNFAKNQTKLTVTNFPKSFCFNT